MAVLRQGSQGPAVATLQAALNFYVPELPPLVVDSVFGPKTDARVREFQRRHGLAPDGIVAAKTEAVLYACGSISASGFAMPLAVLSPRPQFPSRMSQRFGLLPPGGLSLRLPTSVLQQIVTPFQLPPLTPPFLTPGFSGQLGPGQQARWPATASSWEFWSTDLMVLSRKLEIKAEISPERVKMGSLPGWQINVVGTAKWTILPERLRRPSIFLQASAQSDIPPENATGGVGLGIDFKGNTVRFNFEGNSAFDVDPQGRAGTDAKVPEANFKVIFEKSF